MSIFEYSPLSFLSDIASILIKITNLKKIYDTCTLEKKYEY